MYWIKRKIQGLLRQTMSRYIIRKNFLGKWINNFQADCFKINICIQFLLQLIVFGIPGVSGANVPQLVVKVPRYQKGIQGKPSLEENDVLVR